MCNLYSMTRSREVMLRLFRVGDNRAAAIEPKTAIFPGYVAPIVRKAEDGERELVNLNWGFVLLQKGLAPKRVTNVRDDKVLTSKFWRPSFEQRRCLVPADGFYEWRRDGNRKFPMLIRLKKKESFAFAGLWDSWRNPQMSEDVLHTFTIITTKPNSMLKHIHNRMPVIYDQAMGKQWLEGGGTTISMTLDAILQPMAANYMEAYEVSKIVNAPASDQSECVQPVPGGQVLDGDDYA